MSDSNLKNTNRKWQNHLRAKGPIAFLLDRLQSHAFSCQFQHEKGPFHFPINERESDDELSRAFFEYTEKFPYEIYLEITNHCNLNCQFCVRPKMSRCKGYMSNELFRKLIDEIAEKAPYSFIQFYGIGESTLDPELFHKLQYAYDKGVRNTTISTNGQLLLKNETYKKLVDSGLSSISVDLDGMSQESYGQLRCGGNVQRVKDGILKLKEYIIEKRLRTRVEVAYHVYPGVNEHEKEEFVDWCAKNDIEYYFVNIHTWGGQRQDLPETKLEGKHYVHRTDRKNPCVLLWNGFVVGWDGKVALCFQDANMNQNCGDVSQDTIEEIWTTKHKEKRLAHVQGEFKGLCENCNSFTETPLPKCGSALYPQSLKE